ncbi:MAG: NfeD family protein [Eubacteriales bacterium]|nr:NfeD family protein [Eubacteriales bacterium]
MLGLFDSISIVSIVLFCVGMLLLFIELFMPGIGVFGGLGIISLVLCIIFQAKSVTEGLILLLIIGAIVAVVVLIAARSFGKGRIYRSALVLKNTENRSEGYVSNADYSHFAGKKGISITPLRPAGTADFDGEKADVVTDGEFIKSGERIVVLKVSGRRIIVKRAEDEILSGM